MLTTDQLLQQSGATQTGPVACEIAWGVRILHWGPRDWRDLWRALRAHPWPARLYLWVRLLAYIAGQRRIGADESDEWGL